MNSTTEKFWDFSLDLYANEDLASLCLDLQDRFDVDVNMLLFCCWQASMGIEIDPVLLKLAVEFSSKWKKRVVQPLRESRRWMKSADSVNPGLLDQYEQLRQQIKRNELASEKIQQDHLQHLVESEDNDCKGSRDSCQVAPTAYHNIVNYLQLLAIELDEISSQRLFDILARAL